MNTASMLLDDKWQTYLFLTEEMKKFILRNEEEVFYSLLDQRELLQEELASLMQQHRGSGSEERRELLQRVQTANKEMMMAFHATFNAMKRKEKVLQSYEGGAQLTGSYLNQQR